MGEPITYAGVTVQGLVDANDQRQSGFGLEMVDRVTLVTVPYNAFPTPLVKEASVTVNAVAMVIKNPELMRDGGLITFAAVLP